MNFLGRTEVSMKQYNLQFNTEQKQYKTSSKRGHTAAAIKSSVEHNQSLSDRARKKKLKTAIVSTLAGEQI